PRNSGFSSDLLLPPKATVRFQASDIFYLFLTASLVSFTSGLGKFRCSVQVTGAGSHVSTAKHRRTHEAFLHRACAGRWTWTPDRRVESGATAGGAGPAHGPGRRCPAATNHRPGRSRGVAGRTAAANESARGAARAIGGSRAAGWGDSAASGP